MTLRHPKVLVVALALHLYSLINVLLYCGSCNCGDVEPKTWCCLEVGSGSRLPVTGLPQALPCHDDSKLHWISSKQCKDPVVSAKRHFFYPALTSMERSKQHLTSSTDETEWWITATTCWYMVDDIWHVMHTTTTAAGDGHRVDCWWCFDCHQQLQVVEDDNRYIELPLLNLQQYGITVPAKHRELCILTTKHKK